jgi:hypothetical protein
VALDAQSVDEDEGEDGWITCAFDDARLFALGYGCFAFAWNALIDGLELGDEERNSASMGNFLNALVEEQSKADSRATALLKVSFVHLHEEIVLSDVLSAHTRTSCIGGERLAGQD